MSSICQEAPLENNRSWRRRWRFWKLSLTSLEAFRRKAREVREVATPSSVVSSSQFERMPADGSADLESDRKVRKVVTEWFIVQNACHVLACPLWPWQHCCCFADIDFTWVCRTSFSLQRFLLRMSRARLIPVSPEEIPPPKVRLVHYSV